MMSPQAALARTRSTLSPEWTIQVFPPAGVSFNELFTCCRGSSAGPSKLLLWGAVEDGAAPARRHPGTMSKIIKTANRATRHRLRRLIGIETAAVLFGVGNKT